MEKEICGKKMSDFLAKKFAFLGKKCLISWVKKFDCGGDKI
jgi:hypothetical protein